MRLAISVDVDDWSSIIAELEVTCATGVVDVVVPSSFESTASLLETPDEEVGGAFSGVGCGEDVVLCGVAAAATELDDRSVVAAGCDAGFADEK